jgi:hypothetical protein
MNDEFTATRDEAIEEASKWGVGLGIVGIALFPLALPIVILTLVALLPLALPLVALALVGAVVAAPVMLVRRLVRRRRPLEGAGAVRRAEAGRSVVAGPRSA